MQFKQIGILNIGHGNVTGLYYVLKEIGFTPILIENYDQLKDLTNLIIPGVGSFLKAMNNIENLGLRTPLQEFINSDRKKVLGICLGMQIGLDVGFENGKAHGLSLIEGSVQSLTQIETSLKIPHVGWNSVRVTNNCHELNIKEDDYFYFNHSYFCNVENELHILGYTYYGKEFPSIINKGNFLGVQFHPEKSLRTGAKFLETTFKYEIN